MNNENINYVPIAQIERTTKLEEYLETTREKMVRKPYPAPDVRQDKKFNVQQGRWIINN